MTHKDTTMLERDKYEFRTPKYSAWECHMFGGRGSGIRWRPLEGRVPNRFWRWMQFICFGNYWVRDHVLNEGEGK